MIRNWQRGFLPAAGDTEYIDKVFETNAFDSENLYLPGIKADYVLRYAYRTRPVHWERAAEKMLVSNAKDDLLRITYLLNENEAPEHSALVCKRMLTETAFGTSKEAWPLLTRCVRNVDGLIDQLYLAVNMSSRKGNRVFQTLSSLGTPSMAIYDELDPSLRRLKLSTELGL